MNLTSLVDYFIHPKSKSIELELSKSRQVAGIGLFAATMVLVNCIRPLIIEDYEGFIVALTLGTFMYLGVFLLKWTGSRLIAGNTIVFCLYVLISLLSLLSNRLTADTSMLVFVVLLALMFSGLRSGIAWGVICSVTLIGLFLLKKDAIVEVSMVLNVEESLIDSFGSYLTLIVTTLILGAVYEKVSSNNLKKFETAKEKSEQIADNIQLTLTDVKEVMAAVSNSDLSKSITADLSGEMLLLKESVNEALILLSSTLNDVSLSTDRLDSGAIELSKTSNALSDGTSRQAASLEEITSSMAEIETRVKTNDSNTTQSQQLTRQTLEMVQKGNAQMQDMVETINKISTTSMNVTKVIKAIDEIAFQTNLLALNAAVEAARAGKYGKGFSVVAEEVRNLASRSAEAAKNTTELIESSVKEVENGVKSADQTAEMLGEISSSVEKVNDLISEIAFASKEQKNSIEEINKGLYQVNEIVMQNSSISEESASASATLTTEAANLRKMMDSFTLQSQ
ncbi:MAG: methyl-accepting chemotaxis protein [Proteobacteria bacterium]|nr:methyl-accepting chemotaxis protein [Pseudomonadota bacterium]